MSRFDADIAAAREAGVELDDLFAALGGSPLGSERYWAMAQYLSGGDGWRDAQSVLGGTFAGTVTGTAAPPAGLTGGQEE